MALKSFSNYTFAILCIALSLDRAQVVPQLPLKIEFFYLVS